MALILLLLTSVDLHHLILKKPLYSPWKELKEAFIFYENYNLAK